VGKTGAVRRGDAPVEFTVLHVEGFEQRARDEGGSDLVPVGERSRVTLLRPPDEVASALVEFACPTCGRTVSARVRSRAACARLRRGRLARGLAMLLAAALGGWVLVGSALASGGHESPWGWLVFGMVVGIATAWAAVSGLHWTVLALAGKGIAIEGEAVISPAIAVTLGPEDQFHVDGARFVKHSV
jgi:hypothetical protein